jgi:hypothetical protein
MYVKINTPLRKMYGIPGKSSKLKAMICLVLSLGDKVESAPTNEYCVPVPSTVCDDGYGEKST